MRPGDPWKWRIGDRVVLLVDVAHAGGKADERPGLVIDVGSWGVVVAWDDAPAPDPRFPIYVDPNFLQREGGEA